jgi:acyl dehydratase
VPDLLSPHDLPEVVGRCVGESPWRRITQSHVDRFAAVTGDHQWIHVDPTRAAAGPYGTTVAHGFLTLALIVPMLDEVFRVHAAVVVNKGLDRVRFPAPVPTGSWIRLTATLKSATARPRGYTEAVIAVAIEIRDHPRPACTADWRILFRA